MPVFSLSHVFLPVRDSQAALTRYQDILGFDRDGDTLICGFFQITLCTSEHPTSMALGIECDDPENTILEGFDPISSLEDDQGKRGRWWQDADGHRWFLWRPLNEDDDPLPPPLTTKREWPLPLYELMQRLLKETPLNFRKSARKMAVLETEWLAEGRALTEEDVVRGYIRAAPFPLRQNVQAPLAKHGYDWQAFQSDFLADEDD